jgi:phosphonate metabolism protein (transferase hexapeptide repeat family)
MSQAKLGPAPLIDPTSAVRDCDIGPYAEIGPGCRIAETEFGAYSYVAGDAEIIYARIVRFVSIASHTPDQSRQPPDAARHPASLHLSRLGLRLRRGRRAVLRLATSHGVEIGHDAWVGHGAVVMPGRRVGVGAVVGSGSIVTRDIPDYAICVGNPGRILRFRFDEPVRESLKRIAWWDWPHETIGAALEDFRRLPVEAFCRKHDPLFHG